MSPYARTLGWLAVGARAARALRDDAHGVGLDTADDVHGALLRLALDGRRPVLVSPKALVRRPRAALRALVRAAAPSPVWVLLEPDRPLSPAIERAVSAAGARPFHGEGEVPATPSRARPPGVSPLVAPPPPPSPAPLAPPQPDPTDRMPERRRDVGAEAAPRRATLDEVGFADGCFKRLDRPDALCRFVLARLARVTGAARTSLMLIDAGRTGLFVKAANGLDPALVGRIRISLPSGLAGRAASLGRALAGHAEPGGPRAYAGTAYVVLPLGHGNACEGVVSLTDLPADRLPDERTLKGLLRMANRAGRALSAARRLEHAETQSATDELTGLPNRRSFERALGREVERARRAGTPLAVGLVDIDHFKGLNDRFGHPMGDRVLVQVARRLSAAFRDTDLVCRWGGEEFAVVLVGLAEGTAAEALTALERARAMVNEKPLPLGPGLPSPMVSISGGIALFPSQGVDAAELLRRADAALYEAKRTGRNKVLSA